MTVDLERMQEWARQSLASHGVVGAEAQATVRRAAEEAAMDSDQTRNLEMLKGERGVRAKVIARCALGLTTKTPEKLWFRAFEKGRQAALEMLLERYEHAQEHLRKLNEPGDDDDLGAACWFMFLAAHAETEFKQPIRDLLEEARRLKRIQQARGIR